MRVFGRIALACLVLPAFVVCRSQPVPIPGGVRFLYRDSVATTVDVAGDFNGWSKEKNPLTRSASGVWTTDLKLPPGIYQYKFVLDGSRYFADPSNPASVENYNGSSRNSVFSLTASGEILLSADRSLATGNPSDIYPPAPGKKAVYLNIIWHQHQPLYLNPETDQLSGPWVRTHATKDYFDMAATIGRYPDIHCTINLTSTLLLQLLDHYVDRLGPYIDLQRGTIDVKGFWKRWKGRTDPWIDLALKPTSAFDSTDKNYLYRNAWNAFGISEVMISRFPQYLALRRKIPQGVTPGLELFTEQEMREIKFWFFLAYFDPDFLRGSVKLPGGLVCDLSEYVRFRPDGTCVLRKRVKESDCRRMVVEAYKVMASVVPIHRKIRYSRTHRAGQVEIITTPYCHPILPLIYDSDLARVCQPADTLPERFAYPADASAQVAKAVALYRKIFGEPPEGLWPGEGAVAQPVLGILRENGILWTASDVNVLERSTPPGQVNSSPYVFPAGRDVMPMVFRDTELSDRIGFRYQDYAGESAAEDFVRAILWRAPERTARDVMVTVILDGENAWEWYRKDMDAKDFLHALYRKLTKLYREGRIVTTTTSEFIRGNPARGIAPHPASGLPAMTWLWPGSWIHGSFDTWIGEREENTAWEYLLRARRDLGASGLLAPNPSKTAPAREGRSWYAWRAWEEMYAAEGSDWFWWYGNDQSAPGGDAPFDAAFTTHLSNVYRFARLAGATMPAQEFSPIIAPGSSVGTTDSGSSKGRGAMGKSGE